VAQLAEHQNDSPDEETRPQGYGIEEDEWRPAKDIKGTKRLVVAFL